MVLNGLRSDCVLCFLSGKRTGVRIGSGQTVPTAGSIVVKDENLAGHLTAPDFFDTKRYPEIRFVSTDVRVGERGELEVDGDLTIKGHTHAVTGRGSITGPVDVGGVEKAGAELEALIDRRDYGLDFNMTLPGGGLAVANEVKLEVTLELAREASGP